MKFNDLIQKQSRRPIKIVITEQQLRTLASKVISLMEQEQITKTYLLNKKTNGK
jgi:hypothetical protein